MGAWGQILDLYFIRTGAGLAAFGAVLAFVLGGIGSAKGILIAGAQASGILSEKPDLFGKLLVLMALPGTQGFYGFICAIMASLKAGLISGNVTISPTQGIVLFYINAGAGIVFMLSAIWQGKASAMACNLVSSHPEEAGKSILIPALVETYAVVALLADILLMIWVTGAKF